MSDSNEEFNGKKSSFVTPRQGQGKVEIPRVENPEPPAPVTPDEVVDVKDEQGVDPALQEPDDSAIVEEEQQEFNGGDDSGEDTGRRRRRR